MTDAFDDVVVTVAPGTGRAARRPGALMFDPTGDNTDLIERFVQAADDDAAVAAVKQHLIAVEFAVAPLVVIDWRGEVLDLIVFGDTDVKSSAPAAPMISGVGSGTWIERRVGALELGDTSDVAVWSGDETDPATDLRLGVIRCGGVHLHMNRTQAPAPVVAEPAEPVEAVQTSGAVQTNGVDPFDASTNGAVAAEASVLDAASMGGAANGSAAMPVAPAPAPDDVFEDSLTEPLSQIDGLDAALNGDGGDAGGLASAGTRLVESVMCQNGHANPPSYTMCHLCAVVLDPAAPRTLIEQPAVGFIRFTNGAVVEVDRSLVIGRKPATAASAAGTITVDHAEVSRSHIEVKVDGWSVLVTDLGSRNGTWVNPPSDPSIVKLDANVPHLLEHGATIHLGGPEAAFTYEFGSV